MSVPARKKSRSSVRRRRSHDALKPQNVGACQACSAPVMPHRACKSCGAYKGKQALDVKAKKPHTHDHSVNETSSESEEKAS